MTLAQAQDIASRAAFTESKSVINDEPTTVWDIVLIEPIGGIATLSVPAIDKQVAYDTLISQLLPIELAQ